MANGVKHVALHQLSIVKGYIDKKFETLLTTLVASDSGIHGLRYKDGKLQHQDADGVWQDVEITDSGGGTVGDGGTITEEDLATDEEVNDMFKV